jgi:hypothetical protein
LRSACQGCEYPEVLHEITRAIVAQKPTQSAYCPGRM